MIKKFEFSVFHKNVDRMVKKTKKELVAGAWRAHIEIHPKHTKYDIALRLVSNDMEVLKNDTLTDSGV